MEFSPKMGKKSNGNRPIVNHIIQLTIANEGGAFAPRRL